MRALGPSKTKWLVESDMWTWRYPDANIVYRFSSAEFLSAVAKDTMFFSDPRGLNDLWDMKLPIESDLDRSTFNHRDSLRNAYEILLDGHSGHLDYWHHTPALAALIDDWFHGDECAIERIPQVIWERANDCGVACFSQNGTNPVMWAHYAAKHTGYSLVYAEHSLFSQDAHFYRIPVTYSSRIAPLTIHEILFSPTEAFEKQLSTKTVHWAYEEEWRLINFKQPGKDRTPDFMELIGMIAGVKADTKAITEKAEELRIPAFQYSPNNVGGASLRALNTLAIEIAKNRPYKRD